MFRIIVVFILLFFLLNLNGQGVIDFNSTIIKSKGINSCTEWYLDFNGEKERGLQYFFDKKGRLIEYKFMVTSMNEKGEMKTADYGLRRFTYDTNIVLSEKLQYEPLLDSILLIDKEEYFYNKKGDLVQKKYYSQMDGLIWIMNIEYDSLNRKIYEVTKYRYIQTREIEDTSINYGKKSISYLYNNENKIMISKTYFEEFLVDSATYNYEQNGLKSIYSRYNNKGIKLDEGYSIFNTSNKLIERYFKNELHEYNVSWNFDDTFLLNSSETFYFNSGKRIRVDFIYE